MPISENAFEAICRRDASRTDMQGRKLPNSMLQNRISTQRVIGANREVQVWLLEAKFFD